MFTPNLRSMCEKKSKMVYKAKSENSPRCSSPTKQFVESSPVICLRRRSSRKSLSVSHISSCFDSLVGTYLQTSSYLVSKILARGSDISMNAYYKPCPIHVLSVLLFLNNLFASVALLFITIST